MAEQSLATLTAELDEAKDAASRQRLLRQIQQLAAEEAAGTREEALTRIAEDLLTTLERDLAPADGSPVDIGVLYNEFDLHVRDTRGISGLTKRQKRRMERGERQDLPISHLSPERGEYYRQGARGAPKGFVTQARDQDAHEWALRESKITGEDIEFWAKPEGHVGRREERLLMSARQWRTRYLEALPSGPGDKRLATLELPPHPGEPSAEEDEALPPEPAAEDGS